MTPTQPPSPPDLSYILSLLPQHVPLAPQPPKATLTPLISELQLHPSIEALLHLLNSDLPSAHFLCRHMQAPPAVEGMLLHAMLHRLEGDWNNARAWLTDVGRDGEDGHETKSGDEGQQNGRGEREQRASEFKADTKGSGGTREGKGRGVSLLQHVYGSMPLLTATGDRASRKPLHVALDLIEATEIFRMQNKGSKEDLNPAMQHETQRLLDWCTGEFGKGRWEDATSAWVRPEEKVRKIGEEMVSGGKGWREF